MSLPTHRGCFVPRLGHVRVPLVRTVGPQRCLGHPGLVVPTDPWPTRRVDAWHPGPPVDHDGSTQRGTPYPTGWLPPGRGPVRGVRFERRLGPFTGVGAEP